MSLEVINIKKNINLEKVYEDYSKFQEIDKISCQNLSYNTFFDKFMLKNLPVIISDVSDCWECTRSWITHPNLRLNTAYLKKKISSDTEVPVAKCSETAMYNAHEKITMKFNDYLRYWTNYIYNHHPEDSELLYLKDWHLKKMLPDYKFYKTPKYFSSDFLNEYLTHSPTTDDDYMFVYFGPKNTWTPFHADVFGSYSWSTNIFGKKKWLLLKPKQENKLRDKLGNLPFSISEEILDKYSVQYIAVIQNAGESLFVPSDWYHQVWNIDDTISINHNWFNGCNIMKVWKNLKDHYVKVLKEIHDCTDMEGFPQQCQMLLKASFGMDYTEFFNMIKFVAERRLDFIKKSKMVETFDSYEFGKEHIIFDLNSILKVLYTMESDTAMIIIGLDKECTRLIERIEDVL